MANDAGQEYLFVVYCVNEETAIFSNAVDCIKTRKRQMKPERNDTNQQISINKRKKAGRFSAFNKQILH